MKYEIKIPDMSCNHCVMKITNILKSFNINVLEVSLEKKVLIIDKDIKDYDDKIKNELSDLGYEIEYSKKID